MLRQALKGAEPTTLFGVIELAVFELCLILPFWVGASVLMGAELPSWGAMGVLTSTWIAASILRHVVARYWRRSHHDQSGRLCD